MPDFARLVALMVAVVSCGLAQPAAPPGAKPGEWHLLFDGKTLEGWRESAFTGRGPVRVENGEMVLAPGGPMTGATYTGPLPRNGYEVRYEAVRRQGNDFFAALTFPVGDSFATLVTGGWGGDIVGISSIDGWHAADNETRTYFNFENGRWYRFRLMVNADRIQVWIDDQQVVNVNIAGRVISLRPGEIERSAPFGFASFLTGGAVRKVEYRLLRAPEAKTKPPGE